MIIHLKRIPPKEEVLAEARLRRQKNKEEKLRKLQPSLFDERTGERKLSPLLQELEDTPLKEDLPF